MKKTLQIHIGGRHFHMNEDAYQNLSHYLDKLKAHFAAEGESGREIVEDIEQRIAELLENRITEGKQAVTAEDVTEIIKILGKVEDFVYTGQTDTDYQESGSWDRRDNRRFYRDPDNNYIGGVASGLGKYFDIDPLWIRLAFFALIFLKGVGIIIYIILWIVVPKAHTTAEKLQMKGMPVNLSTIKESVNAEYEKVKTNLSGFSKSSEARKATNALESLIRALGLIMVAIFKFIIGAIGITFLVVGSLFLAALIMLSLGFTNILGDFHFLHGVTLPDFSVMFANTGHYTLVIISLILVLLIPIVALIYGGIRIIFNIRTKNRYLGVFLITAWFLALFLFVTLVIANGTNYAVEATGKQSSQIETGKYPKLHIQVRDNTEDKRMTVYSVFDHKFNYSKWDESLYTRPRLHIVSSKDSGMYLSVEKRVKNIGLEDSEEYLDEVAYYWDQKDSVVSMDEYFYTGDDEFWMFPEVDLTLRIPDNQVIVLSESVCELLVWDQQNRYCSDSPLTGKEVIMTNDGLQVHENQKRSVNRNK